MIEVAYALPDHQLIIPLEVNEGVTALEAVELSAICEQFPGLSAGDLSLGVFGKKRPSDFVLRAGDRVEIYRELLVDPKEVRRQRASKKAAQEDPSVLPESARSEASGK